MPAGGRTKSSPIFIPGKGTITRGKSGRATGFVGKGPAPAGTTKNPEKSYDEVPTLTVSNDGSVSTSGYGSQAAARGAVRAQKARSRKVKRVLRTVEKNAETRSRERPKAPKPYKAPDVAKPVEKAIDLISDAPKAIQSEINKAAVKVAKIPQTKVTKAFGKPTLGTPKVFEVVKAKKAGGITRQRPKSQQKSAATAVISSKPRKAQKTNPRKGLVVDASGRISTPRARKAVKRLSKLEAKRRALEAPLPGLDAEQERVVKTVLKVGDKMKATPKEKLSAVETALIESNARNLNYGDADSLGWRQERTSIYGNGPDGPTDVGASAKRYFEESISDTGGSRGKGQTPGELAQTIQGSAFPERYDEVAGTAKPILRQYEKGGTPPPPLRRKLKSARGEATKLGIAGRQKNQRAKAVRKEPAMWGGKKRGKVTFASWMTDEQKQGITNPAMRIGRAIAGQIGKPIEVISGYRPGSTTTSGNVSDHASGDALDIHALDQSEGGGVKGEREGNAIATAAARVAGLDTKSPEFKSFLEGGGVFEGVSPSGYRVQILWKTDIGGNHHNHVHVGVRAEEGAQPGITGATVSGGGGSVSFVSGGQVSQYAQATGQSVKQVGKKIVNGKLGPFEILEKLESLGVGGSKSLGVGESSTATSQPSTSVLDELESKYGAAVA